MSQMLTWVDIIHFEGVRKKISVLAKYFKASGASKDELFIEDKFKVFNTVTDVIE